MHRISAIVLTLLLVPAAATDAWAGKVETSFNRFPLSFDQKDLDLANVRERLVLVGDADSGHFLVHVAFEAMQDNDSRLFYGDGKTFHLVPTQSYLYNSEDDEWSLKFVDQRYNRDTSVDYSKGSYRVKCGNAETIIGPVPVGKSAKILKKASFERSPFDWTPHALARNERGEYFYVDKGRWAENEKAYRVFKGMKGKLERQKLKNVVSDSEGEIFSTTAGDLRLVLNRGESRDRRDWEYWWVTVPKKKSEEAQRQQLTIVPPDRNAKLIYNELGVYRGERLGTPCDDL